MLNWYNYVSPKQKNSWGYNLSLFHITLSLISNTTLCWYQNILGYILWSVNTLSCQPSKIVRKFLSFSTIINNYFSITVYLIYKPGIFWLYNAISLLFWIINAPSYYSLETLWISKHLLNSGYTRNTYLATINLIFSNTSCSTNFHLNFKFSYINIVNGWIVWDLLVCISL